MSQKTKWVWQSFIICFLFNGILAGAIYWPLHEGIKTINKYIQPMISNPQLKKGMSVELSLLVSNLQELSKVLNQYGYLVLFGMIACVTLAMWIILVLVGRSKINRAIEEVKNEAFVTKEKSEVDSTAEATKPEVKEERTNLSAIQFIALMQREGRFVDFLEEDISAYDDGQIGAAVRTLHDEWRKIFNEHVKLEPIYQESEGTEVLVEKGFDASAVRLTGKVIGDPPFRGIIKHRGWKLIKIDLPKFIDMERFERKEFILAPAEVEVFGGEGVEEEK